MTWNLGIGSLGYNATELLATGDLTDEVVVAQLQKEILETAHAELEAEGKLVNQWSKNLVERRLDVVRMAQGGAEAYKKHEIDSEEWNDHARDMLLNYGLDQDVVDKYPFQEVNID